jgi:glycosyltransferase involved in cell wall biosynthesis
VKVLWFSNSPWASTGYGNQTKLILPHLAERYGAEGVACASNFGLQGTIKRENGIRHYPMGWHPYSDDVAPVHAAHHFGDDDGWVITLFDTWVFDNPMWRKLNVASWTPVDHDRPPPKVLKWFKTFGAVPIAMSQFGERVLAEAGLEPMYAPHGIDCSTFKRYEQDAEGQTVRAVFQLPADRFIVGMVANNKGNQPPRKGFGEAFQAFARFLKRDPDALLFLHSDENGAHNGIDLRVLAETCGIPPENIDFTDGYTLRVGLPDERMAQLYSAFDVLLAPSYGEGFGIPVVEAQACGTPVIVTDWTAQTELVGDGFAVPAQPWYDPLQPSFFGIPSIGAIVEALKQIRDRSDRDRQACRKIARAFAKGYDQPHVWDKYWAPIFDQLEGRLPGSMRGVELAGAIR